MTRLLVLLFWFLSLASPTVIRLDAQSASAPSAGTEAEASTTARSDARREADQKTVVAAAAAVAATAATRQAVRPPDFLEHLVDVILELFNVRSSGNTVTHYVISCLLLVGALILRRLVTSLFFGQLKRLASKTRTTLDDKLLPALESPVATAVMLIGIFSALKVLKLSPAADQAIGYGSTVAFSLVLFWGLWRALGAILDHGYEIAVARGLGIAAFMPWIKKTLLSVFVVFGVLLTAQSLGFEVRAFLAGLGIGGLAFALAAQDTIANLFGSIVVAIDQPFKAGDAIKIGANEGVVEDIGLRSTRLRTLARNLIIIPNKMVAAEPIINNSRFIRRRFEQVLGLTYSTSPDQMEGLVEEIRQLILADAEVLQSSVMVFFRDLSASSLDIWVVYETTDPDFQKSMRLKQRLNLAFMRAVERRGLAFAFPTQTLWLEGLKAAMNAAPSETPPDSRSQR